MTFEFISLFKDIKPAFCQKFGGFQNNKNGPVIVHFNSSTDRNAIFQEKKKLKGSEISIVEELTKTRYELMLLAKEKFGKQTVWTIGGNIFVNVNNKKRAIKSEIDVNNIG